MNREYKRRLKKQISKAKKNTVNEAKRRFQELAELNNNQNESLSLPEGTKVKLNVKSITSKKDYETGYDNDFKRFINEHKNDIFTVEYDKLQTHTYNLFVCLKEDPSIIKWLFYVGDLLVLKEQET